MPSTLNETMEFDHVVQVHPDGSVTDGPSGTYAPEVYWVDGDPDTDVMGGRWTLLRGFTGQHGYNGPIMHPSEYVGGGLERHILANPGLYVVVEVVDPDDQDALVGWTVATCGA